MKTALGVLSMIALVWAAAAILTIYALKGDDE